MLVKQLASSSLQQCGAAAFVVGRSSPAATAVAAAAAGLVTPLCAQRAHLSSTTTSSSSSRSWTAAGMQPWRPWPTLQQPPLLQQQLQQHTAAAMHLQPSRCAALHAATQLQGALGWRQASTKAASCSSSSSSSSSATPSIVAQQNRERAERQKAASIARQMAYEFKAVTIGRVVDPYRRPQPLARELAMLRETGAPVRLYRLALQRRLLAPFMRWYTLRKLEQAVPGAGRAFLPAEAAKIYIAVCQANAAMQPDLVRDLVSKDMFHKLKALADRRRSQGWATIEWGLEDGDEDHTRLQQTIELVQARMVRVADNSPFEWFQLTFRISSRQRFAAYFKDGSLAHGDPGRVYDTHEFWVLERKVHTHKPEESGRWRFVGDLDVQ